MKEKLSYEPPQIKDLFSQGLAFPPVAGATGPCAPGSPGGTSCGEGTSFSGNCTPGNGPSGQCSPGQAPMMEGCTTGEGAGSCIMGIAAGMQSCVLGGIAAGYCYTGGGASLACYGGATGG